MSENLTLNKDSLNQLLDRLEAPDQTWPSRRQPIHVVYGGAQLFKAETTDKLARIAREFFERYTGEPETLSEVLGVDGRIVSDVHALIKNKLRAEPVEDFRIDFEDGYGPRPDDEEDAQSITAARETAKARESAALPPFFGIRIKPLSAGTARRAIRTLDLYLTNLREPLPNFVVTLPKVNSCEEVSTLAEVLERLESELSMQEETIGIELMVETARSIIAADGRIALPSLVHAGRGRVRSVHFGAYDYSAELGVALTDTAMQHPASDLARHVMQVSLARTNVHISDGATNILPIERHRGENLTDEMLAENMNAVRDGLRLHYNNCRNSLASGFYQGWDLHPAQIVARLAAVYSFFLEQIDESAARLRHFVEAAARATRVGEVFDDAATGQGLLNLVIRAVDCGAIEANEAANRTGIPLELLRTRSFERIIKGN